MTRAILKTLAYFDIFDYPLTLVEVWKWLYLEENRKVSLNEVEEGLKQLSDKVGTKEGFWFLKGRPEIIKTRLERYSIAEEKFKKLISQARILRQAPWIKLIAVCNRLAYSNTDEKGDIDLFIITAKNRLWLTRLLVVGYLKIINLRPRPDNKEDAIDTNFFLSEDSLKVDYLGVDTEGRDKNRSLVYWLDQLIPVYETDNAYQRFLTANSWLKEYLPNSFGCQLNGRRAVKQTVFSKIINSILSLFAFESLARKFQLKIMPSKLKEMMNKDSRVMVNGKLLKFHLEDKRENYLKLWRSKLNEIG